MARKKGADTITVRMKTAMAGHDFSHRRGQLVTLDAEMGASWIESGIAEEAASEDVTRAKNDGLEFMVKQLRTENDDLRRQLAAALAAKGDAGKAKPTKEKKPAKSAKEAEPDPPANDGDVGGEADTSGEADQPDPSADFLNPQQ